MPPELKKPINSIAEIICSNCVCHNPKDAYVACHNFSVGYNGHDDFFCTNGQWIIMLDKKTPCLISFEGAYRWFLPKEMK